MAGGTVLSSAPSVGFWLAVDAGTCPLQWWLPSLGCSFRPCSGGGGGRGGERLAVQEREVGQSLGYNHLCIAASVLNQQETFKSHLSYEH